MKQKFMAAIGILVLSFALVASGSGFVADYLRIRGTDGIDIDPSSDADADLLTVGVTGEPILSWDESSDSFRVNKSFIIGAEGAEALAVNSDNSLQFMQEISTPANPAANTYKVYFKSDGLMYSLDSTGQENPIGSGLAEAVASKSANYTATTSDDVLLVDASSGAITVTLFSCSSNAGQQLFIKKTDSTFNNVTIDGSGSETIDGASTRPLNIQNESMRIVCDGSNAHILEKFTPQVLTAYSPTPNNVTLGTGGSAQARWRKDGDLIEIIGAITLGTGGSFTGIAGIPLPSGLSPDTGKIDSTGDNDMALGSARAGDADASTAYSLVAEWTNARSQIEFQTYSSNVAGVNSTIPFTWASGDELTFNVKVPISGWE